MSDEQDRQRNRDAIRQRKRNALRDRAKRGELTGEEADAKAKKLGGGPLSITPDPEKFRPEHWTLTMALVWILYRDLNKVREWDAEYCAEWWRWVHPDAGWELERPPVPTLLRLQTRVADGNAPKASMSVGEAEEQLLAMLQKGSPKASGIDPTTTTGLHVEIPALDWLELVPVPQHVQNYPGKGDEVRPGRGGLGKGYRDVRVPSTAVRSCFPAPGEKPILTETKAEASTPEVQPKDEGGAPVQKDWDLIVGEVILLIHVEGVPEKTEPFAAKVLDRDAVRALPAAKVPGVSILTRRLKTWLAPIRREQRK